MQQKNYSQIVLDHYRNPRNFGKLKEPTHTAEEVNPLCGDEIKVYLRVKNGKNGKNGKIEDIRYEARGCALSIAVASILAERIVNRELRIEETGKMEKSDIEQMLGIKISPARESCILLSFNAINKALSS